MHVHLNSGRALVLVGFEKETCGDGDDDDDDDDDVNTTTRSHNTKKNKTRAWEESWSTYRV